MKHEQISVLVVEDSLVAQLLLVHILNGDSRLQVVGTAQSGEAALKYLKGKQPDVILMDIHMPGMDGFEATRQIMQTQPVPIVVCSAVFDAAEAAMTFKALEAGAVALVAKPVGPAHPDYETAAAKLVETVVLMSEIRLVKRWSCSGRPDSVATLPRPAKTAPSESAIKVVAIGASTGGPPVLQTLLTGLPNDFPIPVLIVQHIAAGFLSAMVEWLNQTAHLPIRIAAHGEDTLAGHAYIAPDGYHMGLSGFGKIALSKAAPENGLRPSVSYLFRSVAAACSARAAGVLLTGMGRDGATELKLLQDAGAVTIAQDAQTSIVHGMAGEAIKLGAAKYVLAPDQIAILLANLAVPKPEAAAVAS